jgi:hypothetical protein
MNKLHYRSYVSEKCTKSKNGALGHPEKNFSGHQDIAGKNGTNGNPGNVTSHNSLIALQLFAFL